MPYIEKIGRLVHGGGCLQVRALAAQARDRDSGLIF